MANLKRTDSPTSRRIVSAFLDFLHSVEPAPGVDLEGLEVAKDCLTEVFGLRGLPESERPEPNLLVNSFTSQEKRAREAKAGQGDAVLAGSSTQNYAVEDQSRESKSQANGEAGESVAQDNVGERESLDVGVSRDELFGKFFGALERIHFFRTTPTGDDDQALLDKATSLFNDAFNEMEKSACEKFDQRSLADALKTLGNKAMESKLYSDAIERYSCAIALCGYNAVYYCNRAAAYTQIRMYNEAIRDCLKSIDIDPSYSKAYSRLGLAYYALGQYSNAINLGFKKALGLDPNNNAVKENIRVAELKLKEEQEQRRQHQDSWDHTAGGSGNSSAPPPFSSVSFDASSIPANFANIFSSMSGNASGGQNEHSTTNPMDFANMFMNMAGNAFQGQNPGNMAADGNQENGPTNPFSSVTFETNGIPGNLPGMFMNLAGQFGEAQGGSNIDGSDGAMDFELNNDQTPEEMIFTLRSVAQTMSGASGADAPNNNDDGRPGPR